RRYLIGFKSDGDLSYVPRHATRKVTLIAVRPDLSPIEVNKLDAVLVEQRYVSVLVREPNGSYKYQSVQKDLTRSSQPLKIAQAGTAIALPSAEPGTYYLSIRDGDLELNRISFSVAGQANEALNLERNAELSVTLNRRDFEPGATIEMEIRAPFAGSGVITI